MLLGCLAAMALAGCKDKSDKQAAGTAAATADDAATGAEDAAAAYRSCAGLDECTRRCEADDAPACAGLGLYYQDGKNGAPVDIERAIALYQRACDLGAGVGCFNLGLMYEFGSGVTPDPARAQAHYDRARAGYEKQCEAGGLAWCVNLAIMYEDGTGVARDLDRARAIFDDACQRGGATGCLNLAETYRFGKGVAADPERAAAAAKRGCEIDRGETCMVLAVYYIQGVGVAPDRAKARQLFQSACDQGIYNACTRLAATMRTGDLGSEAAADHDTVFALLERACAGADSSGCEMLAYELAESGPRHDPARSVELFDRACQIASPHACMTMAARLYTGHGVERDLERARALAIRACKLGLTEGCQAVQQMQGGAP